jgi:HK97 family phage prohead protease
MKKYDFCGYATRYNVKCTDGRTIKNNAFAHMDGMTVPLMFQHNHADPVSICGNALLEARNDGVYAYGSFNDTESGNIMNEAVHHGDITSMSIYANHLKQNSALEVFHGDIKEVSLVLSGANIGAYIEDVDVSHDDNGEGSAIIYMPEEACELSLEHAEDDSDVPGFVTKTIESMTDDQKKVLSFLVLSAENGDLKLRHDDDDETDEDDEDEYDEDEDDEEVDDEDVDDEDDEDEDDENNEGGNDEMKRSVFKNDGGEVAHSATFTQDDFIQMVKDAATNECKLSDAILMHADDYGIKDIESLFPEPKDLNMPPEWIKPEMEWVPEVLNGVSNSPFSRIRTRFADITADEARAKGYVKGNRKKEEVFTLLKRETGPCTFYKKQALDHDDIIDITDFSVVPWIKAEMQVMLKLEEAQAILIGDGRDFDDPDKINESCIRPIWKDDELYTMRRQVYFPDGASETDQTAILRKTILRARKHYKGSGTPTLYCSSDWLTTMLLATDGFGKPLYDSEAKLATALRVKKIVEVPQFEDKVYTDENGNEFDLIAIIVNLSDYKVGANKGSTSGMFEDFDIDFNQHKYLLEKRESGALTKIRSAIVIESAHNPMLTLKADAVAPNVEVLGKTASELQSEIRINDLDEIRGKLKYLASYPGFDQNAKGNFLALKFETTTGATTTVELIGGEQQEPATLESNGIWVGQITSKKQKIRVDTTKDGVTNTKIYSLKYITLAPNPEA